MLTKDLNFISISLLPLDGAKGKGVGMVEPSEILGETSIRCAGHVLQKGAKAGQECNGLLLTQDGYVLCHNEKHPEHILTLLKKALDKRVISETEIYNILNIATTQGGSVEAAVAPEQIKTDPNIELLEIAFGLTGTQRDRDALNLAVLLQKSLLDARKLQKEISQALFEGTQLKLGDMYVKFYVWQKIKLEIGRNGSTRFDIDHDYEIQTLFIEMKRHIGGSVEEYHERVNFYRTAIVALPLLAKAKRLVD